MAIAARIVPFRLMDLALVVLRKDTSIREASVPIVDLIRMPKLIHKENVSVRVALFGVTSIIPLNASNMKATPVKVSAQLLPVNTVKHVTLHMALSWWVA